MSSSWGRETNSKYIGTGVREIICEGHGGILITTEAMQAQPFLAKLKDYPDLKQFRSSRGGYEFEEDCDSSIIYFALGKEIVQRVWCVPNEKIDQYWNSILRSMFAYHPDVYTHLTGIGVSIFESRKLLDEHLVACGHDTYKFYASYRSDSYNVPEGMRVLGVYHTVNVDEVRYFLMTEEEYLNNPYKYRYLPINISGYNEVERPKRIEAAA